MKLIKKTRFGEKDKRWKTGATCRKGDRKEQLVIRELHRHGFPAARKTVGSGAQGTLKGIAELSGDLRSGILINGREVGIEVKHRSAACGYRSLHRWLNKTQFVDALWLSADGGANEPLVAMKSSLFLAMIASLPNELRMLKPKDRYAQLRKLAEFSHEAKELLADLGKDSVDVNPDAEPDEAVQGDSSETPF